MLVTPTQLSRLLHEFIDFFLSNSRAGASPAPTTDETIE